MGRCANCGSENPEGAKFCDECSAPLGVRCDACGLSNRPTAKFCHDEGHQHARDALVSYHRVRIYEPYRLQYRLGGLTFDAGRFPAGHRCGFSARLADCGWWDPAQRHRDRPAHRQATRQAMFLTGTAGADVAAPPTTIKAATPTRS